MVLVTRQPPASLVEILPDDRVGEVVYGLATFGEFTEDHHGVTVHIENVNSVLAQFGFEGPWPDSRPRLQGEQFRGRCEESHTGCSVGLNGFQVADLQSVRVDKTIHLLIDGGVIKTEEINTSGLLSPL